MKDNQMKFKMTISKINVIKGGSVLSGKVEKGEITVGDKIKFKGVDGKQELEMEQQTMIQEKELRKQDKIKIQVCLFQKKTAHRQVYKRE